MDIPENNDLVLHVQPVSETSGDGKEVKLDVGCLETNFSANGNDDGSLQSDDKCSTGAICAGKCEETYVPVPNGCLSQDITLFPDDKKETKSIARQKLFSVVRNLQQQHIAELFPIMDSRETTEGTEDASICRICHTAGDEALIAPCKCKGSAQFVHATCLLTWFKKSVKNNCELCQQQVPIKKKNRPISEWKRPEDRPIPVIWFIVFFVGLCLNILSIHVNASESCKSTACLIFYVVNGFGIVLDAAFLWFWWLKCWIYWKKWCAINQDWLINDSKSISITVLPVPRGSKTAETLSPAQDQAQPKEPKEQIVQV